MRYVAILLLILFCAFPVRSDDWKIPPEQGQVTKNILFVIDTSGSMNPGELAGGISTMLTLVEQSVDEMNVGVIAFSDSPVMWSGPSKKSEKLPKEWLELPDKDGLEELQKWVMALKPGGGTNMHAALKLAASQSVSPLTIVVITDGVYNGRGSDDQVDENNNKLVIFLNGLNESRKEASLEPFTFGVMLTYLSPDVVQKEFDKLCRSNKFFYLQLSQ